MSGSTPRPPDWLSLETDEQVLLRASPSRNLLLATLVVGFVFLTGMSLLVSFYTDLATGRVAMFTVLLFILGTVAGVYIGIERREYVLTSDRVCVGVGLLSTRVSSVALDEVRNVTVEQSGWQQPLNVGSLRFATDDEADEVSFALVDDPQTVYGQILHVVAGEDKALTEIP